jgi:hypothetical protein
MKLKSPARQERYPELMRRMMALEFLSHNLGRSAKSITMLVYLLPQNASFPLKQALVTSMVKLRGR